MYYNDYNRYQDSWGQPVMPPYQEPPKKKKHRWLKVLALCLAFVLVAGVAGGTGALLATRGMTAFSGGGATTIYEGARPETAVTVAKVDGRNKLTADQIYELYVGSTVGITTEIITTNYWGQPVSQAAAGSGFVISADGYILTNYHVIDGAESIKVAFVNGDNYDATLVGGEEENDIAVLKIQASGLKPCILGNSDDIKVGEGVVAIGNPLGELTFSMTQGIVSAKDRSITMSGGEVMNMIQTDTAINSGNSGGPLFDLYGQVIGITSAKLSNRGSSTEATIEGLGFAIPMNDVVGMVKDIMAHGYVTGKPYMGITVSTVPQADAERYGMSQGALVKSVDRDSCAAAAGLKVGDIITAMDGRTILSSAQLIEAKKEHKAGDTVVLTVERDKKALELTLTFDEDTPTRRAAQEEAKQQEERRQQQSQNPISDFFWPFGSLSPWFY